MSGRVSFVRQVAWRAPRWNPPPAERGAALLRQYAMRAGTFSLRPDPPDPWDELPGDVLGGAPLDRAFYLADVDEVDELGNASLTLWESPSGRALYGSLPALDPKDRQGPEPAPGDRLWIWTWRELAGGSAPVPRKFVRVERRELTVQERGELLVLAEELENMLSAEGDP